MYRSGDVLLCTYVRPRGYKYPVLSPSLSTFILFYHAHFSNLVRDPSKARTKMGILEEIYEGTLDLSVPPEQLALDHEVSRARH